MSENDLLHQIRHWLKDRFSLEDDKEDVTTIISQIKKGVEFRGTNVWILIFAILVASVGLNVNSTAVIIGAMLISPLMGPILGLGLSVGINDIELLKKSAKNLAVMVGISLLASTLYFAISPLDQAQNEILARTTPTIWDVLIAFFGGLAGIVAHTRKEKTTVIPGVAIATALMPPLCTAGFGLATGNFLYFIGAFYLFSINSVCISLAVFLIVRYMRFPQFQFLNDELKRKVKNSITTVVIITIAPSIYLGYRIVSNSVFSQHAEEFIRKELNFEGTTILSSKISSASDKKIEVVLYGKTIDSLSIKNTKQKLVNYKIEGTELFIRQGAQLDDILAQSSSNNKLLLDQQRTLETEQRNEDICRELKASYGEIKEAALHEANLIDVKNEKKEVALLYIKSSSLLDTSENARIKKWIRFKLKKEVLLLNENYN